MNESNSIIEVAMFAGARVAVGADCISLPTRPGGMSVAELFEELAISYETLQPLLSSSRLAVDQRYVDSDFRLNGGERCALIPPVSGG